MEEGLVEEKEGIKHDRVCQVGLFSLVNFLFCPYFSDNAERGQTAAVQKRK
jgi:hypothetical protein